MSTSDVPSHRPISVGCTELPPGMSRRAFFRSLSLLEMRLPGDRPPSPRVAAGWRADAAATNGQLSLLAPRALCSFHLPGRDARTAIETATAEFARTAAQVHAVAVVFVTPPDLSPSSTHRDAMRWFFAEVATAERFGGDGGAVRVWQPDGLWRPTVAAALADELTIVPAVDPLAGDPLEEGIPGAPTPTAYARVSGLGQPGRQLGADDLERLADWAAPSNRAFIAFATATRFRDAVALARTITPTGSAGAAPELRS